MLERNYTSAVERADIDEGLRSYLVSVYNYMAGGLLITALAAFIVANTSMLGMMFDARGGMSGLGWLFFLAPLIVVFAFGHVVQRGTLSQVRGVFVLYSALIGISLAPILTSPLSRPLSLRSSFSPDTSCSMAIETCS